MSLLAEGAPCAEENRGKDKKSLVRSVEAPEGTVYNAKSPACKTAAKHLLYEMLSEYTGISLPWGELIGIRPTKIAMTRLREGDTPDMAAAYMEREHYVSSEKAALAAEIAQREREILSGIHYENGFSLYVGIPFCPTTCLYCSFTSYPLTSWKNRVDEYLDALEREMEASAPLMQGKILDTLYIGGGTPTTLEPAQSRRLIGMIGQYFDLSALQEFTVEAGRPDSINAEKLQVLKECGVGRISVNPQTMRDRTLKLIGRQHSAGQTADAFRLAREAVIRLKKKYPYIRLFLVLPYHPAVRPTKTPPGYDGTFYPDGMERVSRRYAIVKANQKMIDTCDFLISYVVHGASNARNLLEYAERQQKKGRIHVINLGVPREQFTPS